jgi:hypothetical protein
MGHGQASRPSVKVSIESVDRFSIYDASFSFVSILTLVAVAQSLLVEFPTRAGLVVA